MASTPLNSPEAFSYKVAEVSDLTDAERADLYHCSYDILTASYGVTGWAIHQGTKKVYSPQLKPNRSLTARLLRPDSSPLFRNPKLVFAHKEGEVRASLFTAERVTRQPRVVRERWLGFLGLHKDIISQSATVEAGQLSVIDVLAFLAIKQGPDDQPVKAQHFVGQLFQAEALQGMGLRPDSSVSTQQHRLFEPNVKIVGEQTWTADSGRAVQAVIESKHSPEARLVMSKLLGTSVYL